MRPTGGPDAALFRIDDLGTISFKDVAPDPQNPNDKNCNGEYLITITVTDNSDGFTPNIEYVLSFLIGMNRVLMPQIPIQRLTLVNKL